MTNAIGFASASNSGFGSSAPLSIPPPPAPPSAGDAVRLGSAFSGEAIAVPLAPPDAPLLGKGSVTTALGDGMAAVAILAGVFVLCGGVGIPLAFELRNSRGQARLKNQRELFEHDIRELDRKAVDGTLHWVREYEKRHVDPAVIARLGAEMQARGDAYARAKAAGPSARLDEARAAFLRLEPPVAPGREPAGGFALDPAAPPKNALGPTAAFATMHCYRAVLSDLQKRGLADGDTLRLAEAQSLAYLDRLLHGFARDARSGAGGPRAEGRTDEFADKLRDLHDRAAARYVAVRA